jgi:SnoaL-like domain
MAADVEFSMSDGDSAPNMTAGRDETLALLQSLAAEARTAHQVHAPEIDLNGDEARVIWAAQDRAVFDDRTSITDYGHYPERWIRQGDAWMLASLMLSHLITDLHQGGAGLHLANEGGGVSPSPERVRSSIIRRRH